MRRGQEIINQEVTYSEQQELVSTTDLRGVITYVNTEFCNIAGYTEDELLGKNHNIVRHPDMPKAAFKEMWEKLKQGHSWRGMVKNRCKDGRYYWVDAFVTPIYEHGQLVGYQSVRTKPSEHLKTRATALYQKINDGKSIASFRENVSLRQIVSLIIILAGVIALGFTTSLMTVLATLAIILLLAALNYDELIVTLAPRNK
ncbi:PAS domain-containing protein [Pseudoalteromonas sp. JSTW]|nr:PAS domain-containing protein [Pseudoalteromonas sp. JSTW]